MIRLSASLGAKIEREVMGGLSAKALDRMLARSITQLMQKYRDRITVKMAGETGINASRIDRRAHEFRPSGRNKRGKISWLAWDFPAAVLYPEQSGSGVSAEGFDFPHNFITRAQKKSGRGERLFVFRRRRGARYPLMEARVRVYGGMIAALAEMKVNIEREFNAMVARELDKYVRGIKTSNR